jgi:DNA-binding XRE family transcriptional regulator
MAKKFRDLMADWSPERIAAVQAEAARMLREMPLHELRHARNLTQQELASTLRTSQASISKLERRTDVYVSTLRRYIRGMGGELEIIARFPDGAVRLEQFSETGVDGHDDDDVPSGLSEPVVAGRRARR